MTLTCFFFSFFLFQVTKFIYEIAHVSQTRNTIWLPAIKVRIIVSKTF